MALNPTLKKITASVLLVSCINLTAGAAVLPAKQFSVQSVVNNSSTEVSKPYSVSLSEVVKAKSVRPDEKKKKKAIIWIITGAAVIVAIILLSGKKSDPAPMGGAV